MIETKGRIWNGEIIDSSEERSRNEQTAEESAEDNHPSSSNRDEFTSLFENDEVEQFRILWLEIQSRFVDDPLNAVEDADELLSDLIDHITETLTNKKMSLDGQWMNREVSSTEDLRLMLRRYRSFINRLLALEY